MTAVLRRRAEASMRDRCTVTRQPKGDEARPFDEQTLTYGDGPTPGLVFTGRCSVVPDTDQRATSSTEGGQDIYRDEYRARIPLGASEPQIGDVLTVTHVGPMGDPAMVGRDFEITKVIARSRSVTRQLRMIDRTRGPRT